MKLLDFHQTKNLLSKYKIPFFECEIFGLEEIKKAESFAKKIGYPLVLKVFSPKIFHRTDISGVITGIKNEKELGNSFLNLGKIKFVEGILVQKMGKGKEVILGMKRDPTFGPVLMAGLGGIFVEILNDVSFGICPISKREALKMIKEIKGYRVLKGGRNQKGVNIKALIEIMIKLSKLSLEEKDIQEIDFNPVIINEKTAKVADFKFFIET